MKSVNVSTQFLNISVTVNLVAWKKEGDGTRLEDLKIWEDLSVRRRELEFRQEFESFVVRV